MSTFSIGHRDFPSKKAALTAVRAVLNGTELGVMLEGEDLGLIMDLLLMHPEAAEKLDYRSHLVVEKWFNRVDGRAIDGLELKRDSRGWCEVRGVTGCTGPAG